MDNSVYSPPKSRITKLTDSNKFLSKHLSWHGRITRMKYLQQAYFFPVLFLFLYVMLANLAIAIFVNQLETFRLVTSLNLKFISLYFFCWFIYYLILGIKRLHDFDMSGFFIVFWCLPVINVLLIIIPGTLGQNKYGEHLPNNTNIVNITGFIGVFAAMLTFWMLYRVFFS